MILCRIPQMPGVCVCLLGKPSNHAKTAEQIELPFWWGQTRVGPTNHVLHWVHKGTTWRIRVDDLCPGDVALGQVISLPVISCEHVIAVEV